MREFSQKVKDKVKELPDSPGVYIMKDKKGNVIYVGKARVLKNRARQYFTNENQLPKVAAMVSNIEDFEYIITDTEMEALILEANLIKQYRPYYNILLKDDKQYPYIKIDLKEPYPRVDVVRKVEKDGAKYFGPFIAAHVIRDVLDHIGKLYPLRTCKKDIPKAIKKHERPCLNYEMGRCIGPCTGKVSEEEYDKILKEIIAIITGDKGKLKKELTKQMEEAAEELNFEAAANLRDKIVFLDRLSEKQRAGFPNLNDKDVFAIECGLETAVVQSFLFRSGKLNYAHKYYFDYTGESKAEIMSNFLTQYYAYKSGIPKHIYVSDLPEDSALIQQWLTDKKESGVKIISAQKGDNKKLQDLAAKNARDAVKLKEGREKQKKAASGNLAKALGLPENIRRIECYDISNTQGTDNVASMVVFEDGKPAKKAYRRFKIKTFEGANDFAAMEETLTRRLLRGLSGDEGFSDIPDLIIVDGGKGQLSSAFDALASVGCENIPLVSLAKKEEEIFVPGESESIKLTPGSPEFRLVTSIRDEAHRFAITYHRKLREKRIHSSELDSVPGVGEVRKKTLLKHFGSLKNLKAASVKDIEETDGIPKTLAPVIYDALHSKNK